MIICFFYFLLSSLLVYTHVKNYMANRTTSERMASARKGRTQSVSSAATGTDTDLSTSVMSYSDFEESKSMLVDQSATVDDINKVPLSSKKPARKGCCINIWKMTTHTKIVP